MSLNTSVDSSKRGVPLNPPICMSTAHQDVLEQATDSDASHEAFAQQQQPNSNNKKSLRSQNFHSEKTHTALKACAH
jgi:hypothetical protein